MKKSDILVVGFETSKDIAKRISKKIRAKYVQIEQKKFPDSETYLRFPIDVKGKTLIFVADLYDPDKKIVPLVFALQTARELKSKENILVAPYMPYLRQDKRFNEGECISSKAFAGMLNGKIDRLYTLHPHLHRYKSLNDVFKCKCKNLSLLHEVANYIEKRFPNGELIGPDIESSQWVNVLSKETGLRKIILLKERKSSHKVKMTLNEEELKKMPKDKKMILFDDIISSGTTMMNLIRILKGKGFGNIEIICVHGIFAEGSYEKLKRAGAKSIISSNTIRHFSNRIDIVPKIAGCLRQDIGIE